MTPMQAQYNQIKAQYPDDIVLFRLGDFYEAFNGDAETISQVLGITLTGRGKDDSRIPMAGIPHHALDNYLPKLLAAGYRVVQVDQTTEPQPGQLVERAVSKIYTAGTLVLENTLAQDKNNFIISIFKDKESFGVVVADISTGKMSLFEGSKARLINEIPRIDPAEVILPIELIELGRELFAGKYHLRPSVDFDRRNISAQFPDTALKGFGVSDLEIAQRALAGLIIYFQECQRQVLSHLTRIGRYDFQEFMQLDANTIRNLELVYPINPGSEKATLFSILNNCQSQMGARKLREWLLHPYLDSHKLQQRWNAVAELQAHTIVTSNLRSELNLIADMERIVGRLGANGATARDLWALSQSINQISRITESLTPQFANSNSRLSDILTNLADLASLQAISETISAAIHPNPPNTLTEGHLIADGYHPEVDRLRDLRSGGKQTLAEIQAREIARTGITSLKVSYNKVFGYYLEITNTHKDRVPTDYIRKQTLANAERYITEELKVWEEQILSAEDKLIQLEYNLFQQIRTEILKSAADILNQADLIAELDVLANFAYQATQYRYTQPSLSVNNQIKITGGRHPVVERLQPEFTANELDFNSESQFIILTGPNMSGKSTYIRQVALLVLMAQIGSFVPAEEMSFSLVDKIFTRVGAGDNLSKGESTFMVEMHEVANILNNATENSLIILDEVGRGTSTYDGVAIAWSIVEYIVETVKAFTLFATHYHELTQLSEQYHQVKNYFVQVAETEGKILFQHKILTGSTSKSYGVHVAEMAGVPKPVVSRAWEILEKFEDGNKQTTSTESPPSRKTGPQRPTKISPHQLDLLAE